jgi:formate C-acetyltransferase
MKASAALEKEADAGDHWNGFAPGDWRNSINVRDFIVRNVTSRRAIAAPRCRPRSTL